MSPGSRRAIGWWARHRYCLEHNLRMVGSASIRESRRKRPQSFLQTSRTKKLPFCQWPVSVSDRLQSETCADFCVPVLVGTASCGLNGEEYLGLPWPSTNPTSSEKVIVVYGGSTSIGSMAIQLASAAGIRVIATASPKNFDLCRTCGASVVVDYKDSHAVDNIIDAVAKNEFGGIFDAISNEQSYTFDRAILEKLDGGRLATSQPPPKDLPSNVTAKQMMGPGGKLPETLCMSETSADAVALTSRSLSTCMGRLHYTRLGSRDTEVFSRACGRWQRPREPTRCLAEAEGWC